MRTIIFLPWFALFLWMITVNNCFFYAKCCRVVCLFTIALLLFQVIDLKSKTVKSYDSMGQRHDDICSLLLLVFFCTYPFTYPSYFGIIYSYSCTFMMNSKYKDACT